MKKSIDEISREAMIWFLQTFWIDLYAGMNLTGWFMFGIVGLTFVLAWATGGRLW